MIGAAIGIVCGIVVGVIGFKRDWSPRKTALIAFLVTFPATAIVLLARSA